MEELRWTNYVESRQKKPQLFQPFIQFTQELEAHLQTHQTAIKAQYGRQRTRALLQLPRSIRADMERNCFEISLNDYGTTMVIRPDSLQDALKVTTVNVHLHLKALPDSASVLIWAPVRETLLKTHQPCAEDKARTSTRHQLLRHHQLKGKVLVLMTQKDLRYQHPNPQRESFHVDVLAPVSSQLYWGAVKQLPPRYRKKNRYLLVEYANYHFDWIIHTPLSLSANFDYVVYVKKGQSLDILPVLAPEE